MNDETVPAGFREVKEDEEQKKTEEQKKQEQAKVEELGQLKFKLRKPIQAHGETITRLELREPTAGDIEAAGNPCQFDFSADVPQVKFDSKAMVAMISRLGAIPPSSVRSMHPKDWNTVAWGIANFFLPDLGPTE